MYISIFLHYICVYFFISVKTAKKKLKSIIILKRKHSMFRLNSMILPTETEIGFVKYLKYNIVFDKTASKNIKHWKGFMSKPPLCLHTNLVRVVPRNCDYKAFGTSITRCYDFHSISFCISPQS